MLHVLVYVTQLCNLSLCTNAKLLQPLSSSTHTVLCAFQLVVTTNEEW